MIEFFFIYSNHLIPLLIKGEHNTRSAMCTKKRNTELATLIGSHVQQNLHERGGGESRRFNYEIANMQATWRWRPSLRLMRLMDG